VAESSAAPENKGSDSEHPVQSIYTSNCVVRCGIVLSSTTRSESVRLAFFIIHWDTSSFSTLKKLYADTTLLSRNKDSSGDTPLVRPRRSMLNHPAWWFRMSTEYGGDRDGSSLVLTVAVLGEAVMFG
jgi:hypothetical protein